MFKPSRALAFSAAASIFATGAYADASLNVDVDIDFPSVIILYCVDDVTIDLDADDLITALGVAGAGTGSAIADPTGEDETVPVASAAAQLLTTNVTKLNNVAGPASLNSVNLVMTDVCAVRAVGPGGLIDAKVEKASGTTLVGPNTSEIVVKSVGIRDGKTTTGDNGGDFGDAAEVSTSGFTSLSYLDVSMTLDLSDVTESGIHSGNGDTFTVTVSDP